MLTVEGALYKIQNLTNAKITHEDFGKALGTGRANISNRIKNKSVLTLEELKKLECYYKVNLTLSDGMKDVIFYPINEIFKIPYWEHLPEKLKIPDFDCVTAERNVIKNHWYLNPDSLCIIPMVGDKMARYWYPIRNGDIIIIDTSQNYIMGNGVYFATSQNNTRFWVREMQVLVNNDIEFKGFSPSGNTTRVVTKEQLDEVGFKIIGKVIKNVSFRL